jgi:hypothetical protein
MLLAKERIKVTKTASQGRTHRDTQHVNTGRNIIYSSKQRVKDRSESNMKMRRKIMVRKKT